MPAQKATSEQLLWALTEVFRRYGYEGASLSLLSQATGLERASLYHRFPGGKEDMVEAVIVHIGSWFGEHVLAPLEGPGRPSERLQRVIQALRTFYAEGKEPCILETLALSPASDRLQTALRTTYFAWRDGFATIAREGGMSAATGRRAAEEAIASIEGALVLSRLTGETKLFDRAVSRLPELLLPARQ